MVAFPISKSLSNVSLTPVWEIFEVSRTQKSWRVKGSRGRDTYNWLIGNSKTMNTSSLLEDSVAQGYLMMLPSGQVTRA